MGAMAQNFQGLSTAGSAAQKIGHLGTIGQGLGAAMKPPGMTAKGVPGFRPRRPGIGQQAQQLAQQAQPPGPAQVPGAGAAAPTAPAGGGAPQGQPPGGPQIQPLPGLGAGVQNPPPFLTPGAAIGGAGGMGQGQRFPQQMLGRGWTPGTPY